MEHVLIALLSFGISSLSFCWGYKEGYWSCLRNLEDNNNE